VVYVCWGHSSCPDTGAELVYTGRAGGSDHLHKGGGGNPQFIPLDNQCTTSLNFLKSPTAVQ